METSLYNLLHHEKLDYPVILCGPSIVETDCISWKAGHMIYFALKKIVW